MIANGAIERHAGRFNVAAIAVGALLTALLFWFTAQTIAGFHRLWFDSHTYSHGYLVALIAAALVVREIVHRPFPPAAPSLVGVALLALCTAGVFASQVSNTRSAAQLLWPALLWSAVFAAGGWRVAARLLLPIGYLGFAVPVWDILIQPLQDLTTRVVAMVLRLTSIPAYIDGNFIHIPSGTFEVAGGCSGLHFLIVALALAGAYAAWHRFRFSAMLLLGSAAVVSALVANWLRVFVLVAVGHLTDMQHYLIQVDHYYFGWVVFMVLLVPVYAIAGGRGGAAKSAAPAEGRQEAPTPKVVAGRHDQSPGSDRWILWAMAIAVVGAGAGSTLKIERSIRVENGTTPAVPAMVGWNEIGEWEGASRPVYSGAPFERGRSYRRDDREVSVYSAYYPVQRQGQEAIYFANRPQGRDGRVAARRTRTLGAGHGNPFHVTEFEVVDPDGRRRLIWAAAHVAGMTASSEIGAKWAQVRGALRGRHDAAVWVLSSFCADDCASAGAALDELAPAMVKWALDPRKGQISPGHAGSGS